MKTLLALSYFIGSILIPWGLVRLGYFLAPPESILNREAVAIERGALKNSEALIPNLKSKETFRYPGALAGLAGQNDDCKVWLLLCKDEKQAETTFKNYAKKMTAGI